MTETKDALTSTEKKGPERSKLQIAPDSEKGEANGLAGGKWPDEI